MISLSLIPSTIPASNYNSRLNSKIFHGSTKICSPNLNRHRSPLQRHCPLLSIQTPRSYSNSNSISPSNGEAEGREAKGFLGVRVPDEWLNFEKALEESEWLRVTLHKRLDDEYWPEKTNVQISKVAAKSYYHCLMEKQTDLGDILFKMFVDLDSISYRDSFHGAFSSAYAALNLILQRIAEE